MPNIGWINGQFKPLEEILVSVEDRGFQFGDGVYEVIRTYGGKPFHLKSHLARLEQSARAIHLPISLTIAVWESRILEGIRLSGYRESKIYIQLTRGVAPRDHQFPGPDSLSVLMTVREMEGPDPIQIEQGVAAITLPDLRWGRCDIKSLNLLPNVLAKQQAREAGAFEAIFVRDGMVTEGASSNVMMVSSGRFMTPALNHHILAGVTRQVVVDLARKEGIEVEEQPIKKVGELSKAEEICLVGTTIEVLPVTRLDGKSVGSGRPGELTTLVAKRFRAVVVSS